MNKKKILSVLAATAVVATNIAPAHAAVVDYIRENDGVYYSYDVKELRKQMAAADLGLKAPMFDRFMKDEDTKYLNDDKAGYVSADKVRKAMAEADLKDEEFILDDYTESVKGEEVKEDIKVVDEEGNVEDDSTELEVKSVSAITDQVLPKGDAKAELKFLVNGKEELTATEFDEKYGEEGYEVSYKYNFDETLNTKPAGTYKYAVEVIDAEGNKLPEGGVKAKDFVDFKLVDAEEAVKVNKLGLFADEEGKTAWENETVMSEDNVHILAAEYENALGQKNTDKDEDDQPVAEITMPKIKSIESSNGLIAYAEGTKIVARPGKSGEVTFTVTFEDDKIEVLEKTIKVVAKAEQKPASIKAEDAKVKAGEAAAIKFEALDQDGEKLRTETKLYYAIKAEDEKEGAAKEISATAGEFEVQSTFKKGNNIVKIYADANKKTELGTFKVEAIDVSEEAKIDEYKLVAANEDAKLDLAKDNNKSIDLNVEAYKQGIKVELDDTKLIAESSDDKIVTVNETITDGKVTVTAVAKGEATITLYTKTGDLTEEVATYDVEVINTTKQIDTLTLKKDTKVIVVLNKNGEVVSEYNLEDAVKEAVVEELEDIKFEVEPVKANSEVIVKIAEINGGKEILLDAEFLTEDEKNILDALESLKDAKPSATAEYKEDDATVITFDWKSAAEALDKVHPVDIYESFEVSLHDDKGEIVRDKFYLESKDFYEQTAKISMTTIYNVYRAEEWIPGNTYNNANGVETKWGGAWIKGIYAGATKDKVSNRKPTEVKIEATTIDGEKINFTAKLEAK